MVMDVSCAVEFAPLFVTITVAIAPCGIVTMPAATVFVTAARYVLPAVLLFASIGSIIRTSTDVPAGNVAPPAAVEAEGGFAAVPAAAFVAGAAPLAAGA